MKPECAFVIGEKLGAQFMQRLRIPWHPLDAACVGVVTITTSGAVAAGQGSARARGGARPCGGTSCC